MCCDKYSFLNGNLCFVPQFSVIHLKFALFACPPSYLSLRLKPRLTFSYSHSFVIASPVIRGISKEKWLLPESNSSLSHFVLKSCLFYSLIFGRCIKEPCLSKSPHWQTQPLSIFSNRLLCFSKISGSLLNPKRTPLISLKTQGFSITLMSCVTFRDLGLCCFCSHHSPTHTGLKWEYYLLVSHSNNIIKL